MKKVGLTVVIIVVLLAVVLLTVNIIGSYSFLMNIRWQFAADFEDYADEFILVKDFCREYCPDAENTWLSVGINEDKTSRYLYDPIISAKVDCPSNVSEALNTLKLHAFPNKDSTFNLIRIQGNRISFCIENGQYALVFSPDTKPFSVTSLTKTDKVFVKRITGDWYHVTVDPNGKS